MTDASNKTSIGRRDLIKGAGIAGAAALASSHARAGTMQNPLSPEQIRDLLKLEPNQTCGYVRLTYKSALSIAPGGLPAPFADGRPLGTALYFMMTPEEPVKLHRILNDQLYHYYLGDPIELLLLYESGKSDLVQVGPDIASGQSVQLFIPGGTFHTARLIKGGKWFLGGSTEWPGVVVDEDVQLGDEAALIAKFPDRATEIRTFPVPV
jgi:predicted cupin superfamily sugar epimerase